MYHLYRKRKIKVQLRTNNTNPNVFNFAYHDWRGAIPRLRPWLARETELKKSQVLSTSERFYKLAIMKLRIPIMIFFCIYSFNAKI